MNNCQKVTNEVIEKIIALNKEGMENRQIAKIVNIHHATVAYRLKKLGLSSPRRQPIDMVGKEHARCKKCHDTKLLAEFQFGRKGKPDEYRFAYCNLCRKTQSYKALNRSVEASLKDKFNRLRKRAEKENQAFDLDFDYFLDMFKSQNGKCFYSDYDLNWQVNKGLLPNSLSTDKIVPEKGYTKGNVVFCCHRINTAKNSLSLDELKKWIPEWHLRICNRTQKSP